jgi:hypothetical protein
MAILAKPISGDSVILTRRFSAKLGFADMNTNNAAITAIPSIPVLTPADVPGKAPAATSTRWYMQPTGNFAHLSFMLDQVGSAVTHHIIGYQEVDPTGNDADALFEAHILATLTLQATAGARSVSSRYRQTGTPVWCDVIAATSYVATPSGLVVVQPADGVAVVQLDVTGYALIGGEASVQGAVSATKQNVLAAFY